MTPIVTFLEWESIVGVIVCQCEWAMDVQGSYNVKWMHFSLSWFQRLSVNTANSTLYGIAFVWCEQAFRNWNILQVTEKGSRSSRGINRQTHGERIMSLMASSSTPDLSQYRKEQCLVSPVGDSTINFITAKENMRRQMKYNGHIYRSVEEVLISLKLTFFSRFADWIVVVVLGGGGGRRH